MICSKDLITLKTPDPETLPLPHIKLIELQWFVNLAAAISAVAKAQYSYNDESDGCGDWAMPLGLSPRESESYLETSLYTREEMKTFSLDVLRTWQQVLLTLNYAGN